MSGHRYQALPCCSTDEQDEACDSDAETWSTGQDPDGGWSRQAGLCGARFFSRESSVRFFSRESRSFSCQSSESRHGAERAREREEKIGEINRQIARLEESLDGYRYRLGVVDSLMGEKKAKLNVELCGLEEELRNVRRQRSEREEHLQRGLPPGSRSLYFLERNFFKILSSIVVVLNILVMMREAAHPEDHELVWLHQLFMPFYVVELVLRAALYQGEFLCGSPKLTWKLRLGEIWGNWLDLVVVVSGVVEIYVMPLFGIGAGGELDRIQIMRLLRLIRVLKLSSSLKHLKWEWTKSDQFDYFMLLAVALSSLGIGVQADFPDALPWDVIENVFLLIFSFELFVRLVKEGWVFFNHPEERLLNSLDMVIVTAGWIDVFLQPDNFKMITALFGASDASPPTFMTKISKLLTIVRLVRIMRLVKLIKKIPALNQLWKGVGEAMASMMWVLMLTLIVLYAFSVLINCMIKDGLVYPSGPPDQVIDIFPNVWDSVFVLFTVMNGDDLEYFDPMIESWHHWQYIYIVFIILSTWAILSILTAVVSEKMIQITKQQHQQDQEKVYEKLEKVVDACSVGGEDQDQEPQVSTEKLLSMMRRESTFKAKLHDIFQDDSGRSWEEGHDQLLYQADLDDEGLKELLEMFEDEKGCMDKDDVIDLLRMQSRALNHTSMMKLTKYVRNVELALEKVEDAEKARRRESRTLVAPPQRRRDDGTYARRSF